jgi:hypothetical protein
MADAHGRGRQGALRPALGVMPGMSPLSETLWRDRTNTEKLGDTSARLTWVDLWVTIHTGGSKQAILQGLTGTRNSFLPVPSSQKQNTCRISCTCQFFVSSPLNCSSREGLCNMNFSCLFARLRGTGVTDGHHGSIRLRKIDAAGHISR